jgi:hypothetical protein
MGSVVKAQRMIESGIENDQQREREFYALAERFRDESDVESAKRPGDELGRMVFGG